MNVVFILTLICIFFLCFSLLFKKEWYFLYLFPLFFSLSPRFSILSLGGGRPVEIRLEDVLLLAFILVVILKSSLGKKYLNFSKTPSSLAWIFFIFILLLSTVLGYFRGTFEHNDIFYSSFFILRFIEFFLFFYFTVALAKNYPLVIKPALAVLVVSGLLNIVWVIYQGVSGDASGAAFFSKIGLGDIYSQLSGGWAGKMGWTRPTLLFDLEPAAAGGYFMLLISLSLGSILFLKKKIKYIVFLLFCLAAIGFSLSRTGLVAVFATIVVSPGLYFVLHYKKMENFIKANSYFFIIVAVVCLILVSLGISFFTYYLPNILSLGQHVSETYDLTARTLFEKRLPALEEHIQTWVEYPMVGHGIPYKQIVDNFYLWIMINAGLLGLFSLISILFSLSKYLWEGFLKTDDRLSRTLIFASLINIFGLSIFMLSFDAFMQAKVMEPFWFIQGLGIASILALRKGEFIKRLS